MDNTVIIPVYNVGQRLVACLDSIKDAFLLARAAYPEFAVEVICVNDGSKDDSGKILDAYVDEVSVEGLSFVAVHQENAGPSVARNKGLSLATGRWVSFVDSDDTVSKAYFKIFIDWPHKADINFFAMRWLYESGEELIAAVRKPTFADSPDAIASAIYQMTGILHERNIFAFMPNKFICNELIRHNKIKFVEGLSLSEDEVFIFNVCHFAKSLSILPNALYEYQVSSSGLTNAKYRPIEWLADLYEGIACEDARDDFKRAALKGCVGFVRELTLKNPTIKNLTRYLRFLKTYKALLPSKVIDHKRIRLMLKIPEKIMVLGLKIGGERCRRIFL